MDIKAIGSSLDGLREMVGAWEKAGVVGALERDLALDRLRRLYDALLAREEPEEEVRREAGPAAEPELEKVVEPVSDEPEETGAILDFRPAPKEAKKVDRRKILSLYDDESPEEAPVAKEPVEPIEIEVAQQASSGITVCDADTAAEAEGTEEKARTLKVPADRVHTTVLGDVLSNGTRVLGDTVGSHEKDLASKFSSGSVSSLRESLGVNDRFLLIRDLFDGDAVEYESAMNRFEAFADLNDAMIFIHDNYNWSPGSEGAKLLVELLTRKLS